MFNKNDDPGKRGSQAIELPLTIENYEDALNFVEQVFKRNHISKEITFETMLLFEALYNNLIEQGFGGDRLLSITTHKSFGELNISLGFDGEPFAPMATAPDIISPELSILRAYRDKFDCRYSYGYNTISICVKRNYRGSMIKCWIGILLAILVYIPISMNLSFDERASLETNIVFPLLKQFANAMLMVGAPITLFSLVRNFTDIHVVSERNAPLRKLQIKACATSCVSIVLGMGTGLIAMLLLDILRGYLTEFAGAPSVSEVINSLVPSNILEPFQTYMPFPMIVVALLIVYALCSAGEYIDILKKAIDICYTLFSKMLNVVMFFLPFFCFLAILSLLLTDGFDDFLLVAEAVLLIIAGLAVMFAFYVLRLIIGGVELGPFLKHLPALIRENLKINSVIDAVPFNIRYCVRNYGFDRKRLSEQLPILAQINLDGNCFLIMMVAILIISGFGISVSWFQILVVMILVLFLSFGAPNQPGSILIGVLIILFYFHAEDLVEMAVYLEVFLGMFQNIVNVTGDIVTVAIENQKARNRQDRSDNMTV